jgi:hypothetical protein
MSNNGRNGRISLAAAERQVGAAIYGGDWIGGLSRREDWLISRYIEGVGGNSPSWIIAGRSWREYPSDPSLVAEVERARDRRDWMENQYGQVYDWLEAHGFDIESEDLDRSAFEAAFAAKFSARGDERSTLAANLNGPKPISTGGDSTEQFERARNAAHVTRTEDGRFDSADQYSDQVERLAEWIFAQHDRVRLFKKLYVEARAGAAGDVPFRKADLLAAYQQVYITEPHAPPVGGWPLREPYKNRLCERQQGSKEVSK